jgi:cation/acetate symporter
MHSPLAKVRVMPTYRPITFAAVVFFAQNQTAWAANFATSASPAATWFFAIMVVGAIAISLIAARSAKRTQDFLIAGGRISPFQNGLALAGDFMSAGAFLGLSALIFNAGFDGLIYAIGYLASWPLVIFLIAGPLKNLGRFTMADALSYRFGERRVRCLVAVISIVLVVFYLVAQMVGAGQVIQLMFGFSYATSVVTVGTLMIICVMAGGMIATTWVQIIKAVLLLLTGTVIAFLAWRAFGYDFSALVETAVAAHPKNSGILISQMLPKDPVSGISLGLALIFGTAGLPHILMRFFTVKDGRDAMLSTAWATSFIGFFFLLLFPIGYGSIALIAKDHQYHDQSGGLIGGPNTVSIHLSHAVGGELTMAFVCAVAFATIIAVVAGLTLAGASSISHDILRTTGPASEDDSNRGVRATRIAALVLGAAATLLALAFREQNVAYMLGLSFALAASANFPILLLSLYWPKLTTAGVMAGGCTGLVLSVLFTILGPAIWVKVLGFPAPIISLDPPTLVTMPATFFACWLVSMFDRSQAASEARGKFTEQYQRSLA